MFDLTRILQVTQSDVRGYAETVYGGVYTYTHEGVCGFLHAATAALDAHVLYLTARPITHMAETRALLARASDSDSDRGGPAGSGNGSGNGVGLPRGPALCNREMLAEAFYRELVLKNTITLKVGRARIPLYPTPRTRSHHRPLCV